MLSFSRRQHVLTLILLLSMLGSANACCGIRFPFAQTEGGKDVSQSPAKRARAQNDLGPPRKDLSRFHGVYGDPAQQKQIPKNFFVFETCDGHLQFGAIWGDVAPWIMKSVDDKIFVQARLQAGEEKPLRLEFEVDEDGQAKGVVHSLDWRESPLVRLGDLPSYFTERECR